MHGPIVCCEQVCEKYPANWRGVSETFMDLGTLDDTIHRHAMRQMLKAYGIGGN